MGRKSDIRAEISSQERKIDEYNRCIRDLRNAESTLKSYLNNFDINVYTPMQHYSVTNDDFWVGNNANNATEQKLNSQDIMNNLSVTDGDAVIENIYRAIYIYEDKITDCKNRIRSLYSELEAILEAERRAARQVL